MAVRVRRWKNTTKVRPSVCRSICGKDRYDKYYATWNVKHWNNPPIRQYNIRLILWFYLFARVRSPLLSFVSFSLHHCRLVGKRYRYMVSWWKLNPPPIDRKSNATEPHCHVIQRVLTPKNKDILNTVLPATRLSLLYPSRRWYSIYRPRRDARLSWPGWWLYHKIVYSWTTVAYLSVKQTTIQSSHLKTRIFHKLFPP